MFRAIVILLIGLLFFLYIVSFLPYLSYEVFTLTILIIIFSAEVWFYTFLEKKP